MISKSWWLALSAGCLFWGQASAAAMPAGSSPPATASQSDASPERTPRGGKQDSGKPEGDDQSAAAPSTVPMDAPVLTIKGFCPGRQSAAKTPCETVITRAEFEEVAAAVQPSMNKVVKQQLASLYPRLLVMAHESEKEGLDREPQNEQMIAFARLQILTQALTRKIQQDTLNVSDQEIADYYHANPETFEEYTLQRLFVPLRKQPAAVTDSKSPRLNAQEQAVREKASEEEMSRLAESLHARAVAGQDLLQLQKEAFDAAGVKVAAPNTSMGKVRRTALPSGHSAIFVLKPGEISPVVSDGGGHYIYKLESKDELGLEQVKEQIRNTLQRQHMQDALDKIQNSFTTEKNSAYFGEPAPNERGRESTGTRPH